jgi:DNA modification methylase
MSITILHGDCRRLLAPIWDKAFSAVITDPPYGVNADNWDKEVPYDILPELLRVSRGMVVWFGSASRMVTDIQNFSVKPDRILIWHVSFTCSKTSANGIFYRYHPLYTWRLPQTQKGICEDVISCRQDGRNWWNHPATKPISLLRRLVLMTNDNDIILDPFMGSGTTGVACKELNRSFVGMEISEEYYGIAKRRIDQATTLFNQLSQQMELNDGNQHE